MTFEKQVSLFWTAATFIRRSIGTNKHKAIQILEGLSKIGQPEIQKRSIEILEKLTDEQRTVRYE